MAAKKKAAAGGKSKYVKEKTGRAPRYKKRTVQVAPASLENLKANAFKPGQSGNPAGRSKGSRNKLSEAFLADLCDDWQEHGAAAIAAVRADDPSTYLRVVASVVPKQVDVKHSLLDDIRGAEADELKRMLAEAQEELNGVAGGKSAGDAAGPARPGRTTH